MFIKKIYFLFFIFCISITTNSQNLLANNVTKIDIEEGSKKKILLALGEFTANDSNYFVMSEEMKLLIKKNLEFSGFFKILSSEYFSNLENNSPNKKPLLEDIRNYGAEAFARGTLVADDSNRIEVRYNVWDTIFSELMLEGSFSSESQYWNNVANMISNKIYQLFVGVEGFFHSKIVYVGEKGLSNIKNRYIVMTDFTGEKHFQITNGRNFVSTPRFSPNGKQVVYMSYSEVGKPSTIWLIDFTKNTNRKLVDTKYNAFTPRFSPSGKSVIFALSLDGNIDLFSVNVGNKKLTRLTFHSAIDTSASYSPDESKIVFNSDRSGNQQLYIMNPDGSDVKRISHGEGRYASPVWSPRGDLIAFTKILRGRFHIGVMRPDGTGERLLTSSYSDDSPVWAPNGMGLMFIRESMYNDMGQKSASLYFVDITGNSLVRIPTPTNVVEADWQKM